MSGLGVGVGLQILGLAVSGIAYARTWRQFAAEESFFAFVTDPLAELAGVVARKTDDLVRGLLRRPRRRVVRPVGVSLDVRVGRVSVRTTYGPVPAEMQAAIDELHRRTQALNDSIAETQQQIAKETEERAKLIGEIRTSIDGVTAGLERRGQRIAVGGIRAQALGLLLIALGLVVQAMGY